MIYISITGLDKLARIFVGVLSFGPPNGMSLEAFRDDFEWVTGLPLPWKELDFPSEVEFLKAEPFRGILIIRKFSNHYYIQKAREYFEAGFEEYEDEVNW